MTTEKGERRRKALAVAAAELLREGGFEAVKHRAVAERAGLPLASTTYYFASLDDLVTAAVVQGHHTDLAEVRALLAALPPDPARPEAAELVLDLLLGTESRHGGLDAVLLRFETLVGAGRRPYLAPVMRELRAEFDAVLGEILARAGAAAAPDAQRALVALLDGTVIGALIEADPDPRGVARDVLLRRL